MRQHSPSGPTLQTDMTAPILKAALVFIHGMYFYLHCALKKLFNNQELMWQEYLFKGEKVIVAHINFDIIIDS